MSDAETLFGTVVPVLDLSPSEFRTTRFVGLKNGAIRSGASGVSAIDR